MDRKYNKGISRRGFLTGAATMAAIGATGALSGCGGSTSTARAGSLPASWDYETDVLVVGGGGGGLVAAAKAGSLGADVILIEKNAQVGGDTALCGQNIQGFWDGHMSEGDSREVWLQDEIDSHWSSTKGQRGEAPLGSYPLYEKFLERSGEVLQWIEDHGAEWVPNDIRYKGWFPQPQAETMGIREFHPAGGSLINVMLTMAEQYGASIMTSTPATSLIVDDSGRVVGAHALDPDDRVIAIKANKGVILTSGSFNANQGMMQRYLPIQATGYNGASTGNTGDGQRMVQAIGGQLLDMDLGTHYLTYDDITDSRTYIAVCHQYGGTADDETAQDFPFIFINYNGERYMAETMGYKWVGQGTSSQYGHCGYIVFDSGEACGTWWSSVVEVMTGSKESQAGISYEDLNVKFFQEGTLDELARDMQVPADKLKASIERYNGFVEKGIDEDFNKSMRKIQKLEIGPYYAVRMRPRHYTTYGGINTDVNACVLSTDGKLIPGLYAAGTCCGSFAEREGLYYSGGVGQSTTFGFIAAEMAMGDES